MPFDAALKFNKETPEQNNSAGDKKGGRPRKGTRLIGLGVMREGLLNDDLNEVGRRRLEALMFAKENGYAAAAEKFEVSKATLTRWKNLLTEANGDPISLNSVESSRLDIEQDMQEILNNKFPVESYMSTATNPETGIEYAVVDVAVIKQFIQTEMRYGGTKIRQGVLAAAVLERHHDGKKVLTKEQAERGDYSPRPLFFHPVSTEAATNNIDIADSEFHLPLWELSDSGVFYTRNDLYPTENGEQLTSYEARASILLFHPRYGDGRRGKDGRLFIRNPKHDPNDPESLAREPFGRDILKKYGLLEILQKVNAETSRSIPEGMKAELPHLLENQELFLSDIRTVIQDHEHSSFDEYGPKPISPSKYVMYGSVNHYVGKRFAGDVAEPFSDERAAVMREVDGEQVLVAAFNMVSRENASAVHKSPDGKVVARANGPKTQPKEIKYEKLIPRGQEGVQGALREGKIRELQRLVTNRFTDLISVANQAEELIDSENRNLPEVQKVELVEKVRSLLVRQANKVIEIAVSATDADSLKDDLETYTFDKRAFISLVQSLGVEAMLSNPLREVSASELTQAQKSRMVELLHKNYEALYPGDVYAEFRAAVEDSLYASFEKQATRFYVLEDNDEIVSFNRFDDVADGSDRKVTYFGSFNADSTYRGVGSEMLEKTIALQMQNSEVMFAHCDPQMAISQKYIEDGFVATQTDLVAGHFSFEIWRSGAVTESLETKQMTKEDLVALANVSTGPEDDYFVREVDTNDRFEELDEGLPYLLTRYFKHGDKTYAAFELSSSLSKEFTLAS